MIRGTPHGSQGTTVADNWSRCSDHPLLAVRLGALGNARGSRRRRSFLQPVDARRLAGKHRGHSPAGKHGRTIRRCHPARRAIFSDDQRRGYLRTSSARTPTRPAAPAACWRPKGCPPSDFSKPSSTKPPPWRTGHRARDPRGAVPDHPLPPARRPGRRHRTPPRVRQPRPGALRSHHRSAAPVMFALPILRDFITHPDPLIRETAIDSLLVTGGEPAVAIVAPLLPEGTGCQRHPRRAPPAQGRSRNRNGGTRGLLP